MARCDVDIHLAQHAAICAGGVVEGFVAVTASKAADCRDVVLTLSWRTSGKGTVQQQTVSTTSLFSGTLQAGERQMVPFSVALPRHPLSYEGSVVSVVWMLHAAADIAWARDASADAVFWLGPPEPGGPEATAVDAVGATTASDAVIRHAFLAVGIASALLGFAMGTVGVVGSGSLLMQGQYDGALLATAFVALAGLFIVVLGATMVWNSRQTPLLTASSGVTAPAFAHPEGRLPVTVVIQPNSMVDVEQVDVELRCEEVAVQTHGTRRVTSRETVFSQRTVLAGPSVFPSGETARLQGMLDMPATTAWSLDQFRNTVAWSVRARLLHNGQSIGLPIRWVTVVPGTVSLPTGADEESA